MLIRQQRLYLRMVQKLAHELGKHLAILQSRPVLGEGVGNPDRIVRRKPHDQRYKNYSSIVSSAVVPTECRRTPGAAMRSAIAPEGSRDVLRSRRASPNCGSARRAPHGQA